MNDRPERKRNIEPADAGHPLRYHLVRPEYRIELPPPGSDRRSVLAFSLHKAGSTMLNDILRGLCPAVGLTFVSFDDELFLRGITTELVDIRAEFCETGYCYGGFRRFPDYPVPILGSAKTILLVRDPRDILVSMYFSVAYSHVVPEPDGPAKDAWITRRNKARSMSIDDWVLVNHSSYLRSIERYFAQQFLTRPNVTIYRYEDIIFRKRDWVADIADWYGWDVPDGLIADVARSVDIFPAVGDPGKHIRQVRPGNYRAMLSAATQRELNSGLREFLTLFDYPL